MQLMWFRNDLRTLDNSALAGAMQQGSTLAIYVLSPEQWQQHQDADIKIDFQLRNLMSLAKQLEKLNVPLQLITCENWKDLPDKLLKFCQHWQVSRLHFNLQYGLNEQNRDQKCQQLLAKNGIPTELYQDQTLFKPGSIKSSQGEMYQVFTAFKKACLNQESWQKIQCQPQPKPQKPTATNSDLEPANKLLKNNQTWQNLWPAGEDHARQKLNIFCDNFLANYHQHRDFPALAATSGLSAYLNIGVLSIRCCWQAAISRNQGEFSSGCQGNQAWLNELLWREFYQHLIALNPDLSKGHPYQKLTQNIRWRDANEDYRAWCYGKTGFPLIDAAMRQLLATGWMHNRLRMVVAMFLTKNLLIDWRLGESWFMQHLIDGDLAANNGGWQWCASTGTDAAPYFRIFNPVTQSQKFDPEGKFIRQWLPELAELSNQQIHQPKPDLFNQNYPPAMVDLKTTRNRAIEEFSRVKKMNI